MMLVSPLLGVRYMGGSKVLRHRRTAPVQNLMNKRLEGGATMLTKSKLILATAVIIILGAVSPSLAQNSGPPTIDIQKTCRESSSALVGLTGSDSQDTFSSCMNDEQTARDELVKDWATYPALAKSPCINPKEYLPGYVEWQSCIEMTRDVIKLRKEQAASAPASSDASRQSSGRRSGSEAGECPIVKTAEDGSIEWVDNC
jgi:hypothetical protein